MSNLNLMYNTGIDRSESVDSVYSDDNKELKQSDSLDSQIDDINSINIFKSIRTRYLSRVHSVTDNPVRNSIIDQAFYKSNSVPELGAAYDKPTLFKIENVTTEDTNVDETQANLSPKSSEDHPSIVLAEAVLPPYEGKELKRQDAIDLDETVDPPVDYPDKVDDLNPSIRLVKSESVYPSELSDDILNPKLSGMYKGKPKAVSMDNLNTNEEYKDALNEATSIEFLNVIKESEVSLFSGSSDSVFMSPNEKNNNKPDQIIEANNNEVKYDIPIVKAEKILPFPYPDDIKTPINLIQPVQTGNIDDNVEKQFKQVNEELKLTFKAAIERIIGSNRAKKTTPPKVLQRNDIDDDLNPSSTDHSDNNIVPSSLKQLPKLETKEKLLVNVTESISNTEKSDTQTIPHTEDDIDTTRIINENAPPKPDETVDDSVSYHLKINTPDVCDDRPKIVATQTNASISKNKPVNTLTTFVAPIKIGNMNVAQGSPIILSPVLIQPVLLKPIINHQHSTTEPKQEIKKATIYYNDIDQVATETKIENTKEKRVPEIEKNDDAHMKKGLYQKNVKAKSLPFLSWKSLGPNDNIIGNKSPSPSKFATKFLEIPKPEVQQVKPSKILDSPKITTKSEDPPKTVVKLSRSPQFLIENKYYQPLENVPFIINTTQAPNIPQPIQKKEDKPLLTTNPLTASLPVPFRQNSEQENVYEEIGPVISEVISKNENIADDEKISNKSQNSTEDFSSVVREELLKVPRRAKKPKNDNRILKSKSVDLESKSDDLIEGTAVMKEMASITKSVISLSRAPSAKDIPKKSTGTIGEIVQNLDKMSSEGSEVTLRKFSLQNQRSPSMDTNTGSLPRQRPYWKTQEHKRLSHPLRSLNDPPPRRPLRK